MAHPHPLLLGGVAFVGVACILQIVGVATPFWISFQAIHSGLWKACTPQFGCITPDSYPEWLTACQAFGILAIILFGTGALGAAISVARFDLEILSWLPFLITAVGDVCCIVSFVVYAIKLRDAIDNGANFGYSFALCPTAAGVAIGGIVLLYESRKRRDYNRI